ncbi:unnamed protein product [Camellia sinensis]
MGERKVLNKYYPSNFDPAKIPKRRQPKNQQMKVQMMLPMSIRCGTCSNYIYKGTKFNYRKKDVICEDEEANKEKQKKETKEMGDAMKSLENRTLDSEREMDILAALDEVKSMRSTISVDAMLEVLQRSAEEKEKLEEEDEALIKSLFGAPREVVRRIDDDILDDDEHLSQISTDNAETSKNNSKRRKVSEEPPTKPTDNLTETSYNFKNEGC